MGKQRQRRIDRTRRALIREMFHRSYYITGDPLDFTASHFNCSRVAVRAIVSNRCGDNLQHDEAYVNALTGHVVDVDDLPPFVPLPRQLLARPDPPVKTEPAEDTSRHSDVELEYANTDEEDGAYGGDERGTSTTSAAASRNATSEPRSAPDQTPASTVAPAESPSAVEPSSKAPAIVTPAHTHTPSPVAPCSSSVGHSPPSPPHQFHPSSSSSSSSSDLSRSHSPSYAPSGPAAPSSDSESDDDMLLSALYPRRKRGAQTDGEWLPASKRRPKRELNTRSCGVRKPSHGRCTRAVLAAEKVNGRPAQALLGGLPPRKYRPRRTKPQDTPTGTPPQAGAAASQVGTTADTSGADCSASVPELPVVMFLKNLKPRSLAHLDQQLMQLGVITDDDLAALALLHPDVLGIFLHELARLVEPMEQSIIHDAVLVLGHDLAPFQLPLRNEGALLSVPEFLCMLRPSLVHLGLIFDDLKITAEYLPMLGSMATEAYCAGLYKGMLGKGMTVLQCLSVRDACIRLWPRSSFKSIGVGN